MLLFNTLSSFCKLAIIDFFLKGNDCFIAFLGLSVELNCISSIGVIVMLEVMGFLLSNYLILGLKN